MPTPLDLERGEIEQLIDYAKQSNVIPLDLVRRAKAEIAALRAENAAYRTIAGELAGMIEAAPCPNNCIAGVITRIYITTPDVQQQCQWCEEKKTTLARYNEIEEGKK